MPKDQPQPQPLTVLNALGHQTLQADRFSNLPQFWTWQDLLDLAYQGDEQLFLQDWIAGTLPRPVVLQFLDTCPPRWLELQLLTVLARALAAPRG